MLIDSDNPNSFQENFGFFTTQLNPHRTGLPVIIYAPVSGYSAPVIFVLQGGTSEISICPLQLTLEDEPQVSGDTDGVMEPHIEIIKEFIIINKNILLSHWQHEIDSVDLINLIIPL